MEVENEEEEEEDTIERNRAVREEKENIDVQLLLEVSVGPIDFLNSIPSQAAPRRRIIHSHPDPSRKQVLRVPRFELVSIFAHAPGFR